MRTGQDTQGILLQKQKEKNYTSTIVGQSFFDQPVKSDMRTYGNVGKILIGQGNVYTVGCLIDYLCF